MSFAGAAITEKAEVSQQQLLYNLHQRHNRTTFVTCSWYSTQQSQKTNELDSEVQLHSCMIQIVSCEYTLTRDILGWSPQAYSYMYKHTSSSHLLYKTVWGVGVAIQRKWSSIIDSIRICLAYFELWAHRSLYHELASTFRNIQWENLDTCATDWRRRNMSLPVQTRWWLSSKTIIIASTERWPVCWFRPEADLLTCCSY